MKVKTRYVVVGVVALLVVVAGGVVAERYFLPERSTQVNAAGDLNASASILATGTFAGQTGHQVSGTVSVVEDGGTHYLRFENYEQTQGPDVFVYLTPSATPEASADVAAGERVLIDGGADGGESTKEGTFVQALPEDVDPTQYRGVSIWCDDFGVPFGSATLERA